MKYLFMITALLSVHSLTATADSAQVQQVVFEDCSGGGFGFGVGVSHLTCRKVQYYENGSLRSLTFPSGYRAKLTTGEAGVLAALSNSDSKRTSISCVIPNFDPAKGFGGVVGGIGAGMGDGRGGDIAKTWGRNGVSCVPGLAGGFFGSKIVLNIGYLRLPAQP